MANFYSSVVATRTTTPAAPNTHANSFGRDSSTPDVEVDRLLICEEPVELEVFRKSMVGSMLGVTETWNNGATGVPSHSNKCNLYPATGSK